MNISNLEITDEVQRLRTVADLLELYETIKEDKLVSKEEIGNNILKVISDNFLYEPTNIYSRLLSSERLTINVRPTVDDSDNRHGEFGGISTLDSHSKELSGQGLREEYNPLQQELTRSRIDDVFMTIHHKLNFSDDDFLEIVFKSPVATNSFFRKLILVNVGENCNNILTKFSEEITREILSNALNELDISFDDEDSFENSVKVAREELEFATQIKAELRNS